MGNLIRDYSGVAVLVPCLNEEKTIAQVVLDHLHSLPGCKVYVFDNNSTDATAELAADAGAYVLRSPQPGKGNVVQHMFDEIDAEVYLIVDGDATYPAEMAPMLIEPVLFEKVDMCVGNRLGQNGSGLFRRFHFFGNALISGLISLLFSTRLSDVLSGYRAFSRRFVKTVPLISAGFEIETEMTLQAVTKRFVVAEVSIGYGARPEGSFSKLGTYSDGFRILKSLLLIFKDHRPFVFFASLAVIFGLLSVASGIAPIYDYIVHQYVFHIPLAILASGLAVVSMICFAVGLILQTIAYYQRENFELLKKLHHRQAAAPLRETFHQNLKTARERQVVDASVS